MFPVRVVPRRLCTRRSSHCRRPGAQIFFDVNDHAALRGRIKRRRPPDKPVLVRVFGASGSPGGNRRVLPTRDLPPGRYVLEMQAADYFGNRGQPQGTRFVIKPSG